MEPGRSQERVRFCVLYVYTVLNIPDWTIYLAVTEENSAKRRKTIAYKFEYILKKNIYNLGAHSFILKPEIDKATHSRMIS